MWQRMHDKKNISDSTREVRDSIKNDYYGEYKRICNIEDDSQFEGVHVGMIKFMENLFRQRINAYEIVNVRELAGEAVLEILYMTSGLTSVNKDAYPPLELLLYDRHYYTIRNLKLFSSSKYVCPSCGRLFDHQKKSTIMRHMCTCCGHTRYFYKSGAVRSHVDVWDRCRELFDWPGDLVTDGMKFTKHYLTFDFESRMSRRVVNEVYKYTESVYDDETNGMVERETTVVDNDSSECSTRSYVERHHDDMYVVENGPLSYTLSWNVDDEEGDREECWMEMGGGRGGKRSARVAPDGDRLWYCYNSSEDPAERVRDVCADIVRVARYARHRRFSTHAHVVEWLEEWFVARGLCLRLRDTSGGSNSGGIVCLVGSDDDAGGGDAMRNMKKWHREIGTMYKIREFLNHLPVLGFNSSGYDIPLLKKWLFPELGASHLSSPDDLGSVRFIKKSTKYTSVVVPGVIGGAGGLVFLDVMQYLAPGFSLDLFIKSFYIAGDGDDGEDAMKSYFPYEYVTDYSVLCEMTMPLYEAVFSTLR